MQPEVFQMKRLVVQRNLMFPKLVPDLNSRASLKNILISNTMMDQ